MLGVAQEDSDADADYLAEKMAGLRIFEDDGGKMNLSVMEPAERCWRCRSSRCSAMCGGGNGRRLTRRRGRSGRKELYEYFVKSVRRLGVRCETGSFQAMMEVELVNSGPVTILLDSKKGF